MTIATTFKVSEQFVLFLDKLSFKILMYLTFNAEENEKLLIFVTGCAIRILKYMNPAFGKFHRFIEFLRSNL